MPGIPPAKDSDAEDVVWGLQTAEALWKRGERLDAIVWLRRAAQAAGDASDDDRALELARFAAELSESMSTIVPPGTSAAPPAPLEAPASVPPLRSEGSGLPYDAMTTRPYTSDIPPPNRPAQPAPAALPTDAGSDDSIPIDTASDVAVDSRDATGAASQDRGESTSVPPADMVHAGMFNPWDEGSAARAPAEQPAPLPPPIPGFPTEPARFGEEEEVITSVRPQQLAQQRAEVREREAAAEERKPTSAPPVLQKPAPPRPVPGAKKPPPLPPRALKRPPRDSVTEVVAAPVEPPLEPPQPEAPPAEAPVEAAPVEAAPVEAAPVEAPPAPQTDPTPMPTPPPSDPADIDDHTPVHPYDARQIAASSVHPSPLTPPPPSPTQVIETTPRRPEAPERVDLEGVELFADLPDDARAAFAEAATLSALGESEEVSHFALAYVIEGAVDVAATMVDAPALRLTKGAVLRSKGTTEEDVPMRLIGANAGGVVATWSGPVVEEAFRTIPWVEDDLRAAADKVLTLVGITIGPLGERLDASIREHIVGLLTMRSLAPGELVVTAGETVPGLLLIGVGEIELVTNDAVSGVVGCGDFLFAGEVLGAGNAPATARAGAGGALVLFGDRLVAQELLVTCPPLVEVLAGM